MSNFRIFRESCISYTYLVFVFTKEIHIASLNADSILALTIYRMCCFHHYTLRKRCHSVSVYFTNWFEHA